MIHPIIHRGAFLSHHTQRPVLSYTAVLFLCPIMHSSLSHHTPRHPSYVPSCTAAPFLSHHAQRPVPSYTAVPSQCPIMHSGLSHYTPRCFFCVPSCTAACPMIHRGPFPVSHYAQRHPSYPIIHRGALSVSHHAQRPVPSYTALRSILLMNIFFFIVSTAMLITSWA